MKKQIKYFFVLGIIIVNVFFLTACGGSSINSIKLKFKNEGYTIIEMSQTQKDDIVGFVAGFYTAKNINITIIKFNKKELAEQYVIRINGRYEISKKRDVYICAVDKGHASSTEIQEAIDIFDSCF